MIWSMPEVEERWKGPSGVGEEDVDLKERGKPCLALSCLLGCCPEVPGSQF